MRMSEPRAIYYSVYRGQTKADVHFNCPMCGRRSHIIVNGNKKVAKVNDFLISKDYLTQELPFEAPVRTFFRDGICRECQDRYYGTTSTRIKYVKERSVIA